VRVSLVEQAVMRPPEGMEGWRMFRVEYGGHAERCLVEGVLWLPGLVDPQIMEDALQVLVSLDEMGFDQSGDADG